MRAHEFQRLSLNHSPHQAIFCSDCPSKTWVNSILSQIKSDSQRDQFTLLPTVQALEVYFLNGLFLWLWCISGQGSLFFLLGVETTLCKTPHFQWIYGKLNPIYEKLRSDQMNPKSALGGPKPIARTGPSLIKNWSYTSNPCIYFSILLD